MHVQQLEERRLYSATVFLDFDGAAEQTWGPYYVPPTPAFAGTAASQAEIVARVTEKFSPFDVHIQTYDAPDAERVVIGGSGAWYDVPTAGVSYVGSFNQPWLPAGAWVFADNLGNDP